MRVLLQVAPKEVGHGAEAVPRSLAFDRLGRTGLPLTARERLLRTRRHVFRHRKQPDIRRIRPRDCLVGLRQVADPKLHIRLPRAKPHIPHHDIFERNRVRFHIRHWKWQRHQLLYIHSTGTSNTQCVRAACLEGANLCRPSAIWSRNCPRGCAMKTDIHGLPWYCPAPNGVGHTALQDHVVGKQRVQKRLRRVGLSAAEAASCCQCEEQGKNSDAACECVSGHGWSCRRVVEARSRSPPAPNNGGARVKSRRRSKQRPYGLLFSHAPPLLGAGGTLILYC